MQSFIFPSIQVLYLLIKARTGKKKKELCCPQILKSQSPEAHSIYWFHHKFLRSRWLPSYTCVKVIRKALSGRTMVHGCRRLTTCGSLHWQEGPHTTPQLHEAEKMSKEHVPPSLQCVTATLLELPASPSVSWPRLCWNRQPSWLGGLPSMLRSHRVSVESASVIPVYTQKTNHPLISSSVVRQVQTDQEMLATKPVTATLLSDVTN